MSNLVEFSFTMIAYSIIAFIFYSIFFGTSFITFSDGSNFDGLIFYIARASENSMGYLYYEYVYEPTVHGTDNIDIELLSNCVLTHSGATPNSVSTVIGATSTSVTKSDLSHTVVAGSVDRDSFANIEFPTEDSTNYYTSGWH